ncbi:hypothetical protein JCM8208_002550 [Rhodotorula glutinis]
MQSHPPSNLLQPSRPTTATQSSDTAAFGSPGYAAGQPSSGGPPPPSTSPRAAFRPFVSVLPTFSKFAPLRGTVRIRVQSATFYTHREVLALASPFFEGVLNGGWRETEPVASRRQQDSSTTTPVATSSKRDSFAAPASTDCDDSAEPLPFPDDDGADEQRTPVLDLPEYPLAASTASLLGAPAASVTISLAASSVVEDTEDEDDGDDWLECRLRLVEETASSFQDLLCHIYPRLECAIDWINVEDLCRMALKFDMPSLMNACLAFLLPSAAGRPVLCMKIAEENGIPELYKEASRYVLDAYNSIGEDLAILSPTTLLRLERRRSNFLERLLKLGQVSILRDYSCHSHCDEPTRCARLVDEKWRSAFSAAFRFGTPQPSIIYRSLRSLEPSLSSPALHLPFTTCQNYARLWVADLFDRMFGLGITPARNWTSLTLNHLPNAGSAALSPSASGGGGGWTRAVGEGTSSQRNAAKYFLFVEMRDEAPGVGASGGGGRRERVGSV